MRLISWNIQQGGGTRAEQICAHLESWRPDVCVLIEYRNTAPSRTIRDYLQREIGLIHVVETLLPGDKHWVYGMLVASRWDLTTIERPLLGAIPQRWRLLRVERELMPLTLGAAYVPNRYEDAGNKRSYLAALQAFAREWAHGPGIIVGDFNTGRKTVDEEAAYFDGHEDGFMAGMEQAGWASAFRKFHPEDRRYSYWNRRGGLHTGFLIDHAFVNPALQPYLSRCEILHEEHDWPSDHAALVVEWNNGT